MQFESVWKRILSAGWALSAFLAAFAAVWLFAEPFGVRLGPGTVACLFLGALIIFAFWVLGRKLNDYISANKRQDEEIDRMKRELASRSGMMSYCCVQEQPVPVCPLGVTRIHERVSETLKSSLQEARHSYRWLGFTAFNVAHNNRDIFERQKNVKFEFVTLHPDAHALLTQIDKDYRGTIRAAQQTLQGKQILSEISRDIHCGVSLFHHWQLPTFRVILIDDSRALVSIYEPGKDALQTQQIEIVENENAHCSLLNWFQIYYQKVIETERLLGRISQTQPSGVP